MGEVEYLSSLTYPTEELCISSVSFYTFRLGSTVHSLLIVVIAYGGLLVRSARHEASYSAPYHVLSLRRFWCGIVSRDSGRHTWCDADPRDSRAARTIRPKYAPHFPPTFRGAYPRLRSRPFVSHRTVDTEPYGSHPHEASPTFAVLTPTTCAASSLYLSDAGRRSLPQVETFSSFPSQIKPVPLSYEIFSILESKFLFGLDDHKQLLFPSSSSSSSTDSPRIPAGAAGRVRILSIDGGGSPSDAFLAAAALARLESSLRRHSGDPSATVTEMFDVAAGSGAGGVLAAMLFTRGHDGRPLFSAADALQVLLAESRRRGGRGFAAKRGFLRGVFRRPGGFLRRIFGDATLRDTIKPLLIPCYDLATGAPFLFSRADAVETDGYDFRVWEVCAATCADAGAAAVELRSVDGQTRVAAAGGGMAMANPAAAAMTHVLHNKQEFPFVAGVEDLMVVSLAASAVAPSAAGTTGLVRIAGEGVADMVRTHLSLSRVFRQ
ncbi:hypothetical protein BHM03_00022057 [Ensete ventricosum]|uniref:Patatin n=1 Tax=Ensete ventricosum TaxID=4639 RepID=A0A445MGE1_ENSVE|nr:hypothetical protein BHM03_00022057 [Ensete ventricosum]